MYLRVGALFLTGVFLVLVATPLPSAAAGNSPPLQMGYGPVALFPVQVGTPVYAPGDQLWVESAYSSPLQILLRGPSGPDSNATALVQPGVPTLVTTFSSADAPGGWVILAVNAPFSPVIFGVASPVEAGLTLTGRELAGSRLVMNFTVNPPIQFYGGQLCLNGGSGSGEPMVVVPQAMGGGQVRLMKSGGEVFAAATGLGNTSFALSAELYYTYSLLAPNSTTTLNSREVRVASTDSLELSPRQPSGVLSLSNETVARPGLYDLRALFQGAQGTVVSDTQVLQEGDGNWAWMGDCLDTSVYSSSFQAGEQLGSSPSEWPRSAVFTYKAGGVEGYSVLGLGFNVSEVNFLGSPGAVSMKAYQVKVTTAVGAEQTGVGDGAIFLILGQGPATVGYGVGLGNLTYYSGTVGPVLPSTLTTVPLNVSKLQVTYVVGGKPFEGGKVDVRQGTNLLGSAATDAGGVALFYLPSGDFNVTASDGNGSSSEIVRLPSGQSVAVVLGSAVGEGPFPLLTVLVVAAGVGAALNLGVFAFRSRGRARARTRR